jgi:hypothetical protein
MGIAAGQGHRGIGDGERDEWSLGDTRVTISQEHIDAVEAKARVDEDLIRAVLSWVPPSWQMIQRLPSGGAFRRGNVQILFTVQKYEQSGGWAPWLHVSACGRRGENSWFLPDWEDLKRVKNDFIGEQRWGYQVFPSAKDYVNIHPYVLHIYAPLDGKPALPDFTWGLGQI